AGVPPANAAQAHSLNRKVAVVVSRYVLIAGGTPALPVKSLSDDERFTLNAPDSNYWEWRS
ncbi:MAG: hypothetical protein QOD75_2845, partial [Blastocatellia bacterium]|nr:hypothetical protein [Blastocatellia bacterium]